MKIKAIALFSLFALTLHGNEIILSQEQLQNWQIQTAKTLPVATLPLGEFIVEVTTPPSHLYTISLPFEANVKKLFVANYQEVKKGEVLAEVTGTEWIATQQKAISDAIELRHHTNSAKRKESLCKENIIPKKECTAANAELEADKIKIAASKALLTSYGASPQMIDRLLSDLILVPTIPIQSTIDGHIITLNAQAGKSTPSSDALFVIKQEGALWLETDIEASRLGGLVQGGKVHIEFSNQSFETTLLQLSPGLNPINQTRHVRFLAPRDIGLLSGLRATATLSLTSPALKIAKTSIINHDSGSIVFVKTQKGFIATKVKILGEEAGYYFVAPSDLLGGEIATSSLAVLKNLLGGEDE